MSGALGTLPYPVADFSGNGPNPLQTYVDQLSHLHGLTDMLNARPTPAPVGTEFTTSVGMPGVATNALAALNPGGAPIMASDLARARAQMQDAMNLGVTMALGLSGGGPAGAAEGAESNALRVYHGTPHLFAPVESNPLGAFDLSKIGTGEGAQVYGHGIYQAEAEPTARSYREALGGGPTFDFSATGGPERLDPATAKLALFEHLMDHPALSQVEEQPLTSAAAHVIDALSSGTPPSQITPMKNRPAILRTPEGTEAIEHALDFMGNAKIDLGQPTVGGAPFDANDLTHKAAWYVDRAGGDPDAAIEAIDDELSSVRRSLDKQAQGSGRFGALATAQDRLMQMKDIIDENRGSLPEYKAPGHLYESELSLKPEDALHWDLPFSQQSPKVQEALRSLGLGPGVPPTIEWAMQGQRHVLLANGRPSGIELRPGKTAGYFDEYQDGYYTGTLPVSRLDQWKATHLESAKGWTNLARDDTGQLIYNQLARRLGGTGEAAHWAGGFGGNPAAASQALSDAGIKAIRYEDAGSRTKAGGKTYNWVLFDPATINIIRRYGIAGLMTASGAAGLAGAGSQQQ